MRLLVIWSFQLNGLIKLNQIENSKKRKNERNSKMSSIAHKPKPESNGSIFEFSGTTKAKPPRQIGIIHHSSAFEVNEKRK